jgi:hypothetical protein
MVQKANSYQFYMKHYYGSKGEAIQAGYILPFCVALSIKLQLKEWRIEPVCFVQL